MKESIIVLWFIAQPFTADNYPLSEPIEFNMTQTHRNSYCSAMLGDSENNKKYALIGLKKRLPYNAKIKEWRFIEQPVCKEIVLECVSTEKKVCPE